MHYVLRRFGIRLPRGVVPLFFIIAALVAGVFWIGPFYARPAELQLLALSGDGRFRDDVGIPSEWAKVLPPASEATARVPLILAVHNAGAQPARPTSLSLSLPSRFRVADTRGVPLRATTVVGNPLVRYDLPVRLPPIEPGHLPRILTGIDTLWLEPVVPTMYCTASGDSVPEFVSAPAQNPQLLSQVRVFYSFGGPRIHQRQTGLLTVQIDPALVKRTPAPAPVVFETFVMEPQAPRPAMTGLHPVGTRSSWCGDPGQPMELFDALYETAEGGRFFVLYVAGVPRKYLFDLDRDSVIELEMWDRDGDGKFESRRRARMLIPAFLMPYPKPAESAIAVADTLSVDTVQSTAEWLQTFYDTTAGPLRFRGRRAAAGAAPQAVVPAPPVTTAGVPDVSVDSAWLDLFDNTDAGPLRFYRVQQGEKIAPRPKPKPRGPKLLGVPIEEYRKQQQEVRQGRDTLRPDTSRIP